MEKILVQIIMAYIASTVGTINTGIARGRMQPWQVDNAFGKLFQSVIAMTAQAKQPNVQQPLDMTQLGSLLGQVLQPGAPQLPAPTKAEEQVEDKTSQVEQVLTNNPEIVEQIMAKLPK